MTAWSHLPNAQLIDQVLAELDTYPDQFDVAGGVARVETQWNEAWHVAWNTADNACRGNIIDAAWDAAWRMNSDRMWDAGRDAAANAIIALVAYDDADQYLGMTPDQLELWAALSHAPAAILLQPYVRARELIAQLHSRTGHKDPSLDRVSV